MSRTKAIAFVTRNGYVRTGSQDPLFGFWIGLLLLCSPVRGPRTNFYRIPSSLRFKRVAHVPSTTNHDHGFGDYDSCAQTEPLRGFLAGLGGAQKEASFHGAESGFDSHKVSGCRVFRLQCLPDHCPRLGGLRCCAGGHARGYQGCREYRGLRERLRRGA